MDEHDRLAIGFAVLANPNRMAGTSDHGGSVADI